MKRITLENKNRQEAVSEAVRIIKNGGLVVVPFDTVYGLLTDPSNEASVSRINDIKGRSQTKTIGLATSSVDKMAEIADVDAEQVAFMREKTPGKYTFILRDNGKNNISHLCKRDGNIAIRVPDIKLIHEIAQSFDSFLAQTSANKSGQANCYTIEEIAEQFGGLDQFDLVIDNGDIMVSPPSELWDLTGVEPIKIERS